MLTTVYLYIVVISVCLFVIRSEFLNPLTDLPQKIVLRIYTVLGRNLFSIANDCSVNPSDLSKMFVKKQMKYFDVPLEHEWKEKSFKQI